MTKNGKASALKSHLAIAVTVTIHDEETMQSRSKMKLPASKQDKAFHTTSLALHAFSPRSP